MPGSVVPPPRSRAGHARRGAVLALVSGLLATVLVLAPTPQVVSAAESAVVTHHVELGHRAIDRRGEALAVASVASDEGPELRAALDASAGRRSVRRGEAVFQAIGVTAPVAPAHPVLVRGRVGGTWTPWTELEFASGDRPDDGAEPTRRGAHSEPVWLGGADAYELDAPASLTAVDVHLVTDGPARRSLSVAAPAAGAAGAPSIAPRSAWGAQPPKEHPGTTADLKLAVVHHSVSSNTYTAAQVPTLLRSIQAYHQNVQGWNDFAYNFAVDRFGRIWEGRGGGITEVVVGGHSKGFNTGSVGVVVLGDFTARSVPTTSAEAVARVVAWKFALHRVNPASTVPFTSIGSSKYAAGTTVTLPRIVGHRDVQATSCPGTLLYNRLATIRARVAQLVPLYQQGLDPVVLAPDINGDGLIDPLEYRPGASADVQWWSAAAGSPIRRAAVVQGSYRPAVGDFDGNGRSDILWHGTGSTADSMWWSALDGRMSSAPLTVRGSYVPLVGDFDGNGVDDVFWYSTGPALDSVWYFQRNRTVVSTIVHQDLVTGVPLVGDVDGNGRTDIFFYGPGSASDELWRSTGRGWVVSRPGVSGWYDPVMLDATGEGRADIVWYAPGSSRTSRWEFTATGAPTSRSIPTTRLTGRPMVGDFDGDALADVLITAPGAAPDQVWYSTATGIDAHAVAVNGRYVVTTGPLEAAAPETDDVFFLSPTADYLWRGLADRTFTSTKVG